MHALLIERPRGYFCVCIIILFGCNKLYIAIASRLRFVAQTILFQRASVYIAYWVLKHAAHFDVYHALDENLHELTAISSTLLPMEV